MSKRRGSALEITLTEIERIAFERQPQGIRSEWDIVAEMRRVVDEQGIDLNDHLDEILVEMARKKRHERAKFDVLFTPDGELDLGLFPELFERGMRYRIRRRALRTAC